MFFIIILNSIIYIKFNQILINVIIYNQIEQQKRNAENNNFIIFKYPSFSYSNDVLILSCPLFLRNACEYVNYKENKTGVCPIHMKLMVKFGDSNSSERFRRQLAIKLVFLPVLGCSCPPMYVSRLIVCRKS